MTVEEPDEAQVPDEGETDASGAEPSGSDPSKKPLTPEEQMEAYEESLKEDDWGHQPC